MTLRVASGILPAMFFLRSVHTFSSEKKVFEQKFSFSLVDFFSHAAISRWFKLFVFFGSDFFSNGFLNPFIVHSKPSYLFQSDFHFSLVEFCSYAAISRWFKLFFFLWIAFFPNGFLNPFIVHSKPSYLFQSDFHFSLVVFVFTCGIVTLIFCFFCSFCLIFLEMAFPIHS